MGQASKARRKAYRAPGKKRGSGNALWLSVTAVVIVLGIVGIIVSRGDRQAASDVPPYVQTSDGSTQTQAPDEHWHAAFGVNVCGTWAPDVPEFEYRAGTQIVAGLHSHGNGLIHMHPNVPGEAGNNATVGKFLEYAGYTVTDEELVLWDGSTKRPGDDCNGKPGVIRWLVDGKEQDGNPSDYKPDNGETVSVYFTTEDADIEAAEEKTPNPAAVNLADPLDVPPGFDTGAPPAETPPAETPSSAPADSTSATTAQG